MNTLPVAATVFSGGGLIASLEVLLHEASIKVDHEPAGFPVQNFPETQQPSPGKAGLQGILKSEHPSAIFSDPDSRFTGAEYSCSSFFILLLLLIVRRDDIIPVPNPHK